MKINRRHILLLIFLLCLLIVFLPIRVQYSFESTALVYPLKEWHLKRGQDDSYISELTNNETNVISHLKNYKFERGDVSEVHLRDKITNGTFITTSDTIAYIHSYYIENELTRLRSQKNIEEEALKVSNTGEKQALIEQARQQYEFAKQQFSLEKKNFERQQKLYRDSIISPADFELAENKYHLAEINVQIEYNELVAIQSGKKPEEIDLGKQKIESIKQEITTLENLEEQYYIVSPIQGVVSFNKETNGIITISDTSRYILKIPVKVSNIQYLDRIKGIRFSIPGNNNEVDASFIDLDENVSQVSNQQTVLAKAMIDGGQHRIYPGMAVKCRVFCDRITLLQFIERGVMMSL